MEMENEGMDIGKQGSRGWRLENKWMEFKVQGDLAIVK